MEKQRIKICIATSFKGLQRLKFSFANAQWIIQSKSIKQSYYVSDLGQINKYIWK